MHLFSVLLTGLQGASMLRTGHAAAAGRGLLALVSAVSFSSYTASAKNTVVGRCLPGGCGTDTSGNKVWYDLNQTGVGYLGRTACAAFQSDSNVALNLATADCDGPLVKVDPHACVTVPPSSRQFYCMCGPVRPVGPPDGE